MKSPLNVRPTGLAVLLLGGCWLLALPACSLLPEAKSDPTRFYVLGTATVAGETAPKPGAPVVRLRAIETANYLRARPLVVRRGNHEIEFREFARWGEPLELGITRVLREELLARGAAAAVATSGLRDLRHAADLELTVRVLACEGAVDGTVLFQAAWELSGGTGGVRPAQRGDFRATGLRWDGKSEATLARALSEAVAALAAEIAGALPRG